MTKRSVGASKTGQPTAKRNAKRERLFDLSARHLNARGIAGTVLNEIAAELGLSRNTLYYYVRDRDDLAFQCYQRACLAMAEDLAMAREEGRDPAAKLRLFIRASLAFDRPARAVIAELTYFPAAEQRSLRDQMGHNRRSLATMIEKGVASGHFRPCHPEIAADLLIGMIDWARIANDWLDLPNSAEVRERAITAIEDVLLVGVATEADRPVSCTSDIVNVAPEVVDPGEDRVAHITAEASRQFDARGVHGVSLEDVASALSMTRGAIYHYFPSKADLVIRCYRRSYEIYSATVAHAADVGGMGTDKLAAVFHLNAQAALAPAAPLWPQPGYSPLRPIWAGETEHMNRPMIAAFTEIVERGIADGSVRPLDILLAGSSTSGALHGLSAWAADYRQLSVRAIADEVSALLIRGLEYRCESTAVG